MSLFPIQSMPGMTPIMLMMLVSGVFYAFMGTGLRHLHYQIRS